MTVGVAIFAPEIVSTKCFSSPSSSGLKVTLSLCLSMALERCVFDRAFGAGDVFGTGAVCPGTSELCPRVK